MECEHLYLRLGFNNVVSLPTPCVVDSEVNDIFYDMCFISVKLKFKISLKDMSSQNANVVSAA